MTWPRLWRLLAVLGCVLGALVLAACGDDDDEDEAGGGGAQGPKVKQFPADTTLGKIQQAGEVTIGVKFDVPPFGFKNPQTNEVEGFDVDMGTFISEELGVEPKFIEAISDNRIPFLERGTVDLILSTMTINAERDLEIDFSEPYYIAQGRILVPKGSDIKGLEDLGGTSVCTALGSTYEETIRTEAPDADLKLVDTYSECLELLQNKAIDAISTDDVILTGMIIQDDSLEMVGDRVTVEPYGVGIKEGDKQLKEFVDGVLKKAENDGRWEETYQKWVGRHIDKQQPPPDMTLREALELGS